MLYPNPKIVLPIMLLMEPFLVMLALRSNAVKPIISLYAQKKPIKMNCANRLERRVLHRGITKASPRTIVGQSAAQTGRGSLPLQEGGSLEGVVMMACVISIAGRFEHNFCDFQALQAENRGI